MKESILKELGLPKIKIIIYKEILSSGGSTISSVARKMGLEEDAISRMCDSLEGIGLLSSELRNGLVVYKAEPLQDYESSVMKKSIGIIDLISIFKGGGSKADSIPKIAFFEGIEGIKNLYNNILDIGKPIDSFEDNGEIMVNFFPQFVDYFIKERVKRGIENRVICSSNNILNTESIQNLRSVKNIFQDDFPITGDIKICGNYINIISFEEDDPVGISIKDKAIANNFRAIFNYIWNNK